MRSETSEKAAKEEAEQKAAERVLRDKVRQTEEELKEVIGRPPREHQSDRNITVAGGNA